MSIAAIIVVLASIPIATVLLALGLRGRAINDHPICAACRFDLVGLVLPAAAPAPGATCPECGRDLAARGAVRIGQRRPRRGMIAAGIFWAVVALGTAVGSALAARQGFNWNTLKPAWWLVIDARSTDTGTQTRALLELADRARNDRLSATRLAELTKQALATQADPGANWFSAWGDIVEHARANNRLSDADWNAYVRGSVDVYLAARPSVPAGGRIPIDVGPVLRAASTSVLAARLVLTDLRLNGKPIGPATGTFILDASLGDSIGVLRPPAVPVWFHPMLNASDSTEHAAADSHRIQAPDSPGDYTLSATFVVLVGASTGAMGGSGSSTWINWCWGDVPAEQARRSSPATDRATDPDGMTRRLLAGERISTFSNLPTHLGPEEPLALWKVTRQVPLTVTPSDAPAVRLINDPAMLPAIKRGMHVEVYDRSARLAAQPIACRLNAMRIPVAVAFDVFVVGPPARGSAERKLGSLAAAPGQSGGGSEWSLEKHEAQPDGTYELLLRPSPGAAAGTRTITSIWSGEVRIRGLKVGMDHSAASWYIYPSIADHETQLGTPSTPESEAPQSPFPRTSP